MANDGEGRYRVGYALEPKKVESFMKPSLLTHARDRGIDLIKVDVNKPLLQQGPFHCLVHKLYSHDWNHQLTEYQSKHPDALIIDSPAAIRRLQNRISMLEVVTNLAIDDSQASFGVPKQAVLNDAESLSLTLNFPVIAKPLVVDGSTSSHDLFLVFNTHGLSKVSTPVVLQEFVNHGGLIFKVYVVGQYVRCVKRASLPDFHLSDLNLESTQEGIMPFASISSLAASHHTSIDEAEMPPLAFIDDMARGLREALRLHLFNFDMIRDASSGRYLVIDINYFPGYAKLPGFETFLTDFFLDVLNLSNKGASLTSSELGDGTGSQLGSTPFETANPDPPSTMSSVNNA